MEGAEALADRTASLRHWYWSGLAIGMAILLRPDGGMILIACALWLGWRLLRPQVDGAAIGRPRIVVAGLAMGALAFVPLVPWTIRNAITLHELQPVAPVDANMPGEFIPKGFYRWLRTWEMDYASQEDTGFNVSGEEIPFERVPSRAFDDPQQRAQTRQLFDQYNQTLVMTPELDTRFGELARERIADSRLRYYIELPAVRAIGMWLRPRTEMLPVDIHWWTFDDPRDAAVSVILGVWNLALLIAAARSLRRFRSLRWAGLLLTFVVVRTVLIVVLTIPEPRYVLECYPVVLALAGAAVAGRRSLLASEKIVVLFS
jgi:hypothetical protein